MERSTVTYRNCLRSGEDRIIRAITEATGVFYPYEVDIAEELAQTSLQYGEENDGYCYILAEAAGEVAGYICFGHTPCTKDSYDIYWIVVGASFRGTGIGPRLMQLAEQRMALAGGRKVYVETSSRDPYIPARRLYIKCGYKEEAVIRDFYDVGDHRVIYVKDLFTS